MRLVERLNWWMVLARNGDGGPCPRCRDWRPMVMLRSGEASRAVPLPDVCSRCGWQRDVIEVLDRRRRAGVADRRASGRPGRRADDARGRRLFHR